MEFKKAFLRNMPLPSRPNVIAPTSKTMSVQPKSKPKPLPSLSNAALAGRKMSLNPHKKLSSQQQGKAAGKKEQNKKENPEAVKTSNKKSTAEVQANTDRKDKQTETPANEEPQKREALLLTAPPQSQE